MTIRITTTRSIVALVLALAYVGLSPAAPAAADREHQQIMADLRMLQEQTQQLQALMNDLGEALRAVNSRIEDQTSLERKAFADGKVQMDTLSSDIRVVREKVDETNVRLGTITQELESIRDSIPEPGAIPQTPSTTDTGLPGATPPPQATTQPMGGTAPNARQLFESSWADYTGGSYDLAVKGFESYLGYFPKGPRAHEAQLLIGESLAWQKKDMEAVVAYDRVIANYPGSGSVAMAYYKRGRALERLGETARARESYEALLKQFPDAPETSLGKQRLDGLK